MQLKCIKEDYEKRRRFEGWTSIGRTLIWNDFQGPQVGHLGYKVLISNSNFAISPWNVPKLQRPSSIPNCLCPYIGVWTTRSKQVSGTSIVALVMFPCFTGQSSGQLNFPHKYWGSYFDIFRLMFLKRRHFLFFKSLDSLRAERLFQKQSTRWF